MTSVITPVLPGVDSGIPSVVMSGTIDVSGPSVGKSYNVAGVIDRSGSGFWTMTPINPLPSAEWVLAGSGIDGRTISEDTAITKSTTAVPVEVKLGTTASNTDFSFIVVDF